MEKYSQFRDRGLYPNDPSTWAPADASTPGSGIAPFFPVSPEPAGLYLPAYIFLFLFKLPFFLTVSFSYFVVLQWFPLGSLVKKAILWMILGIPGIWWIDLQIDGVKKGSLARKHEGRVPQPSNVYRILLHVAHRLAVPRCDIRSALHGLISTYAPSRVHFAVRRHSASLVKAV